MYTVHRCHPDHQDTLQSPPTGPGENALGIPHGAAAAHGQAVTSTVCLAYGAWQELVDAIKGILVDHHHGKIRLEDIGEELVSQYLYTSGMPAPELVIRTSGEERVSNFLLQHNTDHAAVRGDS